MCQYVFIIFFENYTKLQYQIEQKENIQKMNGNQRFLRNKQK